MAMIEFGYISSIYYKYILNILSSTDKYTHSIHNLYLVTIIYTFLPSTLFILTLMKLVI
jgi:hypothetical protein